MHVHCNDSESACHTSSERYPLKSDVLPKLTDVLHIMDETN